MSQLVTVVSAQPNTRAAAVLAEIQRINDKRRSEGDERAIVLKCQLGGEEGLWLKEATHGRRYSFSGRYVVTAAGQFALEIGSRLPEASVTRTAEMILAIIRRGENWESRAGCCAKAYGPERNPRSRRRRRVRRAAAAGLKSERLWC